jgi:hypothetical protein
VSERAKELFERKPLCERILMKCKHGSRAVAAAAQQPLDAETKTGAQVALHYITLAARLAALQPIIKTMCHPLTQLAGQKQMDSHAAAVFHVWHGHRPWELTGRWRKTVQQFVYGHEFNMLCVRFPGIRFASGWVNTLLCR